MKRWRIRRRDKDLERELRFGLALEEDEQRLDLVATAQSESAGEDLTNLG